MTMMAFPHTRRSPLLPDELWRIAIIVTVSMMIKLLTESESRRKRKDNSRRLSVNSRRLGQKSVRSEIYYIFKYEGQAFRTDRRVMIIELLR